MPAILDPRDRKKDFDTFMPKTRISLFLQLLILIVLMLVPKSLFAFSSNPLPDLTETLLEKKHRYLKIAVSRSTPVKRDYKKIHEDDYNWDYSFQDLKQLFDNIYNSGKRLPHHIYYDNNKKNFMMPIDDDCELEISWDYIFAIICHIEEALAKGMADYIFLPDMGHGHFYLPTNSHVFNSGDTHDYDRKVFKEILNSKQIKILYHTAEMFLFSGKTEDFTKLSPHEQYRNLTRNLLGSFSPEKNMTRFIRYEFGHPVVQNFDNQYQKVAQDIDISASKDGYFPFSYRGRLYYFDISRFSPDILPKNPKAYQTVQKQNIFLKNLQP